MQEHHGQNSNSKGPRMANLPLPGQQLRVASPIIYHHHPARLIQKTPALKTPNLYHTLLKSKEHNFHTNPTIVNSAPAPQHLPAKHPPLRLTLINFHTRQSIQGLSMRFNSNNSSSDHNRHRYPLCLHHPLYHRHSSGHLRQNLNTQGHLTAYLSPPRSVPNPSFWIIVTASRVG